MKKLSKITSVALCVALILTSVFTGVITVSAEEESQTVFNAASEFSVENGNVNGVWSYETRKTTNPTEFTALDAVDGSAKSAAGEIAKDTGDKVAYSGNVLMMRADTQTDDVVLTFTAPYTGIINLSMANGGVVAPYNSVDGVRLELLHNDEIVKAFYDLDNQYNYNANNKYCLNTPLAMVVKAGDKVRIAVGRNKACDGRSYLSPVIKYAKVYSSATYNAYNDFSLTTNPNGVWSYQYADAAMTRFENFAVTESATRYYVSNNYAVAWLKADASDSVTGKPAINMGTHGLGQAVLTFTAPYSGTINLKMANGAVFAPSSEYGSGNVTFKILKNTTVLAEEKLDASNNHSTSVPYGNTGLTYKGRKFTEDMTIDVKQGDVIRFTSLRGNKANGDTYFNPEITYTDFAITEFNAYTDYDLEQNPNGVWGYKYRTSETGALSNLPVNGAGTAYANVEANIKTVTSDKVTGKPALCLTPYQNNREAVLTFTAPYSGTINVRMANGGIFAPEANNDQVTFTLLKNTTVLESKAGLDSAYNTAGNRYFTDTKTYDVNAGDVLYFCVRRTKSYPAATYFNPIISYASITSPEVATGNSYYVSTSGSDSNSGTNEFAPWASLSKLASIELKAGDRICLKAGDTWNEQLVLNDVNATKENPVVITSYGEGNKPVIDLQLVDDATTEKSELAVPAVTLNNSQGVEIRNLKITGTGVGIDLHYENSYNNEYVKIANCEFENITGFHQRDKRERGIADRYYLASAITTTYFNFNMAIKDPALIGLYIENCKTNNCGSLYVNGDSTVYNLNESGARSVSGLFITNTQMIANDYYGAFINGVSGGYMDNCTISGCGDAESFTPGTAGILLATKDFVIQNTTIESQERGGMNYDGVGIDFEQGNVNVIVRNCYIKDNTGAGVMLYDSNAISPNVNCKVINNVFENNGFEAINEDGDFDCDLRIVSGVNYSLSNSEISGNLFYSDNYPLSHQFIYENQKITPPVANTITNNTYSDDYEYSLDSALSESVIDEVAEYVGSKYTINNRVETTVSGEVISADVYEHTGSAKDSTVWGHKYYDGEWKDMTLVENGESFYWTFGTGGTVSSTAGTAMPATRETGAISFTAPKSGRIKIYADGNIESRQLPANWDGVTVSVLNGDNEQICDQTVLGSGVYQKALTASYYNITAGETIYITFSKNKSNAGDSIFFKPVVEYCYDFTSLNNDAQINIIDLIVMKKHIVNAVEFDAKFDIDGDKTVAALDVILLTKYLLDIL